MTKEQVFKILEDKIHEVAKIYSQNSTAIAREYTMNNAIGEIKNSILDLLLAQSEKGKESEEKTAQPSTTRRTVKK